MGLIKCNPYSVHPE